MKKDKIEKRPSKKEREKHIKENSLEAWAKIILGDRYGKKQPFDKTSK